MKQGDEDFDFVKEPEENKGNYIFQKNSKTKVAFYFTLIVLIVLAIAVAVSAFFI